MAPKKNKKRNKKKNDNDTNGSNVANSNVSKENEKSKTTRRTNLNEENNVDMNQKKADAAKDEGNAALKNGNFDEAIEAYTRALEIYGKPNHIYLSNRSAAYASLGRYQEAKQDAEACIAANPDWGKGYSRLGSALHFLGDYRGAAAAYAQGLAKDPTNNVLLQGLTAAQQAMSAHTEQKSKGTTEVLSSQQNGKKDDTTKSNVDANANTNANVQQGAAGPVIGIDLGTTYSCVGVWRDGGVEIVPDEEGRRTTPSIVAFTKEGTRLVGYTAREQATSNSKNTVFDAKRILGQKMNDPQVKKDVKRFPFEVISGPDDVPLIRVEEKGQMQRLKPEQISAMVLDKMKKIAENFLGQSVSRAVITVPAYFSDAQRQATKDAGMIAGLEVMRIINEPTAAALAYGLDIKSSHKSKSQNSSGNADEDEDEDEDIKNILVFDLGGGTFDVSILQIEGGIFEVLATGGDTHLGGEDFDTSLEDFLLDEAVNKLVDKNANKNTRKEVKESLQQDLRSMKRLRVAAEQAKRALSSAKTTSIMLDGFLGKDKLDFQVQLTRAKFEKLNEEPFSRCMKTVKKVMQDAKLKTQDIDDIVLVGGSTRIPAIQEMLSKQFGGKELCKSINPDEAVAFGAAVQGAILGGVRNETTQQLLLVDVTPLSLGIELTGRIFSTIIPRNTQLPVTRSKTYTTEEDNQTAIDVRVFEGERASTDGNNLLGEFEIRGIQRAPRGVPQIEVKFTVDTEGILSVEALDRVTGAKAQTTIAANSGRLSQEEINRMIQDAQRHAEEDRIRLEQAGETL